jgi:hypothetical protein
VLDVKRLAYDTGRFGRSRDSIEHFLGVSLGVLLVFDWRVVELVRLGSEQMGWKWLSDRNSGNLSTDLFGERIPCSTALAARSDPSVVIRMFLNIIVLLLCLLLLTRRTKLISVGLA